MKRAAVQTARVKRLRAALEAVLALAKQQIPDPADEYPFDETAHIFDLIVRRCQEALEKECGE